MTSPQPSGGNGQAPTATTTGNGQAPTGGANMGQASTSHDGSALQSGNGQAPTAAGGTPSQDASERIRVLEAEAAEARREAAANRAAKTELEKLRQAAMTEEEKREAARVKLEADHKTALSELQDYRLRFAALTDGADIGLTTPKAVDAALKLMDRAALEFDAAGKPTNLPKVLAATVKEYPFLANAANGTATPATPQRPAASSGGATNPGTGGQAFSGVVTRAQYAQMSQQERIARNKDVQETLRRYGGTLPNS